MLRNRWILPGEAGLRQPCFKYQGPKHGKEFPTRCQTQFGLVRDTEWSKRKNAHLPLCILCMMYSVHDLFYGATCFFLSENYWHLAATNKVQVLFLCQTCATTLCMLITGNPLSILILEPEVVPLLWCTEHTRGRTISTRLRNSVMRKIKRLYEVIFLHHGEADVKRSL